MSLTRKVAHNTIVQIVGKVITTLISLFLIAALTRYLGVSGYGQYTTIFAYTQFFAVLADFGFFWFLVREISKPNIESDKITNNVLTFRTLIALVIFSLSFLISLLIPQYHEIRLGIGIIVAATFWITLNGTYVGIFQNKLRMDKAAITDILGRIVIFALVLYQMKNGENLNHILWSYFLGNMVNFFLSAYLGRIYLHFRLAFDFSLWKKIFWECLPISVVTILSVIYFKIDTVMLSLFRSATDVGIYGPPYKVVEILLLIPAIFMGNVFPIITRYIYEKNDQVQMVFQKAFDFLIVIAVPIIVGVICLAPRIIEIIAGTDFTTIHTIGPVWGIPATSGFALQILIVAVGISFLSHLFGYTVISLGKQTKLIWPNLILVFFNIGLNLILIPKISYIGAAIATVLTETLVVFLYYGVMRRHFDKKIRLHILWKVVISGIILGLALKFFSFLALWYLVPIGVVVYFASLLLVKGISKEMIREVIKLK
ncbi:MAG: Polysaccharide biosynthesis protein [Berkelbacteria bacterium GW2011_GWA1_36_9]|uniref:Polysaccharide biosynthesis protein n=1 Tax=Berkelbacteria bacterium GW2011_GWA1_36_9 TaxID=1618331 RepID=A0A0G0I393_9BACT|nr:MAG: Polysaccharide biosynthesis protein [Berkelbacteria bacterium GW2011_GWA1_36_9]